MLRHVLIEASLAGILGGLISAGVDPSAICIFEPRSCSSTQLLRERSVSEIYNRVSFGTMAPPKSNLTGFDTRKFVQSSGMPANDPWARAEAWRYTGPFTRWNRFKGGLPGLGIATVAFAAYCGYEYMFLQDGHREHDDTHHSEEHQ